MTQALRKGALNDACTDLAKRVLWSPQGASNDVIETLAAKFENEALFHLEFITGQGRDPNLLTRAILYMAEAHAIPPMGTDIEWCRNMLSCLVELAVPNAVLSKEGSGFLVDVQVGITQSMDDADS